MNSSENGRFSCTMIGKTQPEMEFLKVVTFIYPFSLKAGSQIPSAVIIYFYKNSIVGFYVQL